MAETPTFDPKNAYVTKFTDDDYKQFNTTLDSMIRKSVDSATRNAGMALAREQMKNFLYNNVELIASLSGEFNHVRQLLIDSDEELDSVRSALRNADDEYNELNRKYKALAEKTPTKTKSKKTESGEVVSK